MQDLIVGALAVLIGGLIGFRGYLAMRVIISVWGAFAGFALGAGLVDRFSDDAFLRSAAAWITAIVLAVAFAALAYLYYEVSVVIAMGAIGFTLGTSVMVAIGTSWSWLIILVGVLMGGILAAVAIVADLPTVLLAVLTAFSGASTVVFGFMLFFGTLDTADFESADVTDQLANGWGWYALYVVLVVGGLVSQLRDLQQFRASLRDEWNHSRSVPAGGE